MKSQILKKVQDDLLTAAKEKDKNRVSTLRFLTSAIKNKEIELGKRGELSDEQVLQVVSKQAKQRRESIEAFQKAQRNDLVGKEEAELKILSKYLPRQISSEDIKQFVQKTIEEIKPEGPKDIGKVMGAVMNRVKGRADGQLVSSIVKKALSQQPETGKDN